MWWVCGRQQVIGLWVGNDKGNRAVTVGTDGSAVPLMQALSWPGQGFSFKLVTMMSQEEEMRRDLQYPHLWSAQMDTGLFASRPTRLLVSYLALGGGTC